MYVHKHKPNVNRSFLLVFLLWVVFFHFNLTFVYSQFNLETGLFPVYNFSPKTYNALPQNWGITQDARGIMYFANNQGVLEYDGVNWRIIKVGSGSQVYSLDVDKNGKIYAGSINEFGYFAADSAGNLFYKSLSDKLADQDIIFNNIWHTYCTSEGTIFQAFNYLFIWNGDSIRVIYSEDQIHESFYTGGIFFTQQAEIGLFHLEEDSLVIIPGGEVFANKDIYGIVNISPNKFYIATASSGLYMMKLPDPKALTGAIINRMRTNIDRILENIVIYKTTKVSNNHIALGTWGDGVVVIDTIGRIISWMDEKSGLQDQVIQGMYTDKSGNLWLALSNGISRIEINSPLTFFNEQNGIQGTIQSISKFDNTIYVASLRGLYYLDYEAQNNRFPSVKSPVFKVVEGLNEIECWDLLTFRKDSEEILLVVTNNNILEVNRNNKAKVVFFEIPWKLYQSHLDPARVYVGLESGLASLYRENEKWIEEGKIAGINEEITNLSEDYIGNLWMGTPEQGVLRLYIKSFKNNRINEVNISRYDSAQGLPEGPFIISQTTGPTIVATNLGIYKFIATENRFIADSSFGVEFADGSHWIHRISEKQDPYLWMVVAMAGGERPYHVGYLEPTGSSHYDWVTGPFTRISEGLIHDIYVDSQEVVWLGGEEGLYRYDQMIDKNYTVPYSAYVRNVSLSEGERIFGGTYFSQSGVNTLIQPDLLKITLPYSKNSLVFNYAAQAGENESFLRFSYFLEGNDVSWSEWTDESKKEYTNLHESHYVFRVKAKNIYGYESQEAIYEFTILAPWYRKWWAYISYIILATIIVYIIIKLYTRQLRQIIKERTAEVVRQKDKIEKQKEEIEHKNNDIMDSIRYAQKIQTALLPPEEDLSRLEMDGFILFMPRDIVSGDFYWVGQKNAKTITVAADCTGHGVPGAFMSMLGISFLNNIISGAEDLKANEILNDLRRLVIANLRQKGHEGEQKDGMDLALHIIDREKNRIEFSGANNPLILVRNNEIIQVKADRMPIGIHERAGEPFNNNEMEVFKGDVLYTFSDGFQDQFGGPDNKKFMIKNLKELFVQIYKKPMEEQKEILRNTFQDWINSGGTEQIDDVIVIGIRI